MAESVQVEFFNGREPKKKLWQVFYSINLLCLPGLTDNISVIILIHGRQHRKSKFPRMTLLISLQRRLGFTTG